MFKNEKKIISVIGGRGFIGKYLVNSLLDKGYYVNVISRNAEQIKKEITTFKLGQCRQINCDIKNKEKLTNTIKGSNIVINLVGLLESKKKNTFENVHVEGVKNLVSSCNELNIDKIIHLSAIGAEKKSSSKYATTKYKAEKILNNFKKFTIIRPSIVYGDEDNFINLFAKISKVSPFLPLIGEGRTKFQPIWVQDLVNIILLDLEKDIIENDIIEVGGEDIISFKEILMAILKEIEIKRILVNIPFSLASKMALFAELLPKAIITRDQIELLKKDNIISKKYNYKKKISYVTQPFEIMLSKQLKSFKKKGGHFFN